MKKVPHKTISLLLLLFLILSVYLFRAEMKQNNTLNPNHIVENVKKMSRPDFLSGSVRSIFSGFFVK